MLLGLDVGDLGLRVRRPIGGLGEDGARARRVRADDLEVPGGPGAVAHDPQYGAGLDTGERVGQENHRALEALGLVQIHEPHDVAAAGLEGNGVDIGGLQVLLERARRVREAAAGLGDLAQPVHGVEQVAGLGAGRRGGPAREEARRLEEALDGGRRGEDPRPPVHGLERAKRADHGALRLVGKRRHQHEAVAGLSMLEELRIAESEERPPQHADERDSVIGVGEGAEEAGQRRDALGLDEGRAAAHLGGDAKRLEGPRIDGDILLLPGEDEEVAEGAAAAIHLGADEPGDARRVGGRDQSPVDVVADEELTDACARLVLVGVHGIEAVEGRLLARRFRGEEGREDLVGPAAEHRHRAERGRQLQPHAARGLYALLDAGVGIDVRPPEAVDGLLRIADDEERPRAERGLRPVRAGAGLRRQQQEHLGLDRVGVLELVHEEPAVLALERRAQLGSVAQQACRDPQEVAVGERVRAPARLLGEGPAAHEEPHRETVEVLAPGREERLDRGRLKVPDEALELGLDGLARLAIAGAARPPLLDDLRGGLPAGEQLGQRGVAARIRDAETAAELPGPLLDAACRLLGDRVRQPRLDLRPEGPERGPRFREIRRGAVRGGEVHVGVTADVLEGLVELVERQVGVRELLEERRALRALAVEILAPRPLEQLRLGRLVQLREARHHARLHRSLAQEVRAEGVDRAGEEPLEMAERPAEPPGAPGVLLRPEPVLQLELETSAQLGRGLAGEGDGGHVVDQVAPLGDPGGHAAGEALRLAGAGAGLDEHVDVEALPDQVARGLVGDHGSGWAGPLTHAR